jgi:hypothetical protein
VGEGGSYSGDDIVGCEANMGTNVAENGGSPLLQNDIYVQQHSELQLGR